MKNVDIILRKATKDDIDDLMPLFKSLYRGDIGQHFEEILVEYINSQTQLTAVALLDGNIVGLLVGSYRLDIDYECRAGLIDAIVVKEGFRQRCIGKKLLSHFVLWARSKNCTVLQTLNGRREFFEPRGFKERLAVLHQVPIDQVAT